MPRNIRKYAEYGAKRLQRARPYNMTLPEMDFLADIANKGGDGFWDAISISYKAGVEAGYRMRKKEARA